MLKRVIFAVGDDELGPREDMRKLVLERQISYFADEEGLDALLDYLDDNPRVQVFCIIRDGFGKEKPRRPVRRWKDVDADLRDSVAGLTNFEPAERLTAHEALEHRWFDGV